MGSSSAVTATSAPPYAVDPGDCLCAEVLLATRGEPIAERLRRLLECGLLDLARPGTGSTWARFRRLAEIGAEDLSLARLAEGHADAASILDEAAMRPEPAMLYGVWVAGAPLRIVDRAGGHLVDGTREYCSGSGTVERALITARRLSGRPLLLEIDARAPQLRPDAGSWPAAGMTDTASYSIQFDEVPAIREVGPEGWYGDRRGFWDGSPNVAACWYGGAVGLAREVSGIGGGSNARILGAEIYVLVAGMQVLLRAAADRIDHCPGRTPNERELDALRIRDQVYRGCMEVITLAAELGGTGRSTHRARQARRLADLPVYLRQHHPGRDRERICELIDPSREATAERRGESADPAIGGTLGSHA